MDLDKLFTVTDYETKIIAIPCHGDGDDERPDQDHEVDHLIVATTSAEQPTTSQHHSSRSIEIEIVCSPSASTDYDLTGQILWPVSILLAHYLALASSMSSKPSTSTAATTTDRRKPLLQLRGLNVVELGAGTGLPGLVAAACGARSVTLTDGNEIVCDTILQKNIVKFQQKHSPQEHQRHQQVQEQPKVFLSSQQLVWGNRTHFTQLWKQMEKNIATNRVDVVLAADVVQWPAVVEPLLHTVKALLWNAHMQHHDVDPTNQQQPPIFLLGIVNRATSTYNLFFQLARELGFEYRSIQPDEWYMTMPEEGGGPAVTTTMLPDSCREYGGRETEIYELTLKSEGQVELEPPVLLQPRRRRRQDNGKDDDDECDDEYSETVGKSFQNTASLPC